VTGPTAIGSTTSTGNLISRDGSVVAGLLAPSNGFVWSNGVLTDIGTLGGGSQIVGLSSNGSVVAGTSNNTAFIWTSAGGISALPYYAGGNSSAANAISLDGTTVVGSGTDSGGATYALRWVNGVVSNLGSFGGIPISIANDVSANGSVVVGYSYAPNDLSQHAFRWSGGVLTDIGSLGLGGDTVAKKVSADGSTIIGVSGGIAFRWNSGAMIPLALPGAGFSDVSAVTPDGATVVGQSGDANGNNHAYRWKDGVIADITPMETVTYVLAKGVSDNGEVVVGYSGNTLFNTRAWRWTAATGETYLSTLLANAGVDMTGINLRQANAISGNGEFIVGTGSFNGATRAYVLRYNDGAGAIVAGLTTPDSQQQSVTALTNQRTGMMAQEHGMAAQLLGGGRPSATGGEAGVYASGGSASAGGHVRYTSTGGFSILAGAAWAREDYASAELKNSWIGAGALQYVYDGFGTAVQPLVEVGGWYSPRASLAFTRRYDNGAGTAAGIGNTRGDLSYFYGRVGAVVATGGPLQFVLSGEYGKQKLATSAYAEGLAANPFNATVSDGTDAMDVFKARAQGSHDFGICDVTLWAALASGFNRGSTAVTTVAGVGQLTPSSLRNVAWAEYGARLGYKVTELLTVDVFANGVSGGDEIGARLHGGAGLRMKF
jgi:probable HAF family extracellular repeat protein